MAWKEKPTIQSLRREIVADSLEQARLVKKLIQLVREDERAKTLESLERTRQKAGDR